MEKNGNASEQRVLKFFSKIQQWIGITAAWLVYLGMLVSLILTVFYAVRRELGIIDPPVRLKSSAELFIMISTICAGMILFDLFYHKFYQKDLDFDPHTMELPPKGTVGLETALHRMAGKIGVIIWDTVIGIPLILILLICLILGGDMLRISLLCLALAVLLISGHFFFGWRWKKKSYIGELIANTKKYLSVGDARQFTEQLEESLHNGILYYAKEMVLTEDFIIGIVEIDTSFIPVAVPRNQIIELTYYCTRPVLSNYRRYNTGVLNCRMYSNRKVELLIGMEIRSLRVLKVLNYYHIPWKNGSLIYN